MKNFIYEIIVFDGQTKDWRVLNLNTGTIYTTGHKSYELALSAIRINEKRGDFIVKHVKLCDIEKALNFVSPFIE